MTDIAQGKQTVAELRASEQRLRILFEHAPDAFFLNDLEGRFVDANRAGEQLVGYCRKELIGKSFFESDLFSHGDLANVRLLLAQSARGEATGPTEITLNRKDGSRLTAEVRTYPIQVLGQLLVLGIARDITERKRAEDQLRESREQLRALAGRLQAVREEERTRLARNLHDGLAQELTLLKLDSGWLGRRLSQPLDEAGQRALKGQTDKMIEAIDHAIESVQTIAAELRPVVLDIFMPGGGGFEVLARIASSQPRLPVLVLSSAPEEQLALRALQAGAAGYLNKQAAGQELVRALRQILSGLKYLSDNLAQRLATEFAHPSPHIRHERLSAREFQVFQMLVGGKSLKQIAAELSLSPKTVSTFHTRILEKPRLQNDVELVRYALENRLAELAPTTRTSPG